MLCCKILLSSDLCYAICHVGTMDEKYLKYLLKGVGYEKFITQFKNPTSKR